MGVTDIEGAVADILSGHRYDSKMVDYCVCGTKVKAMLTEHQAHAVMLELKEIGHTEYGTIGRSSEDVLVWQNLEQAQRQSDSASISGDGGKTWIKYHPQVVSQLRLPWTEVK